jgi:hypothetical protein
MSTIRERWIFTIELPAGVANPGRFVARLLKHLLRCWGVRCTAVLEAPKEEPSGEHHRDAWHDAGSDGESALTTATALRRLLEKNNRLADHATANGVGAAS